MIRTTLLLAALLATLGIVGPTLDDYSSEQAQADDLQDAIRQEDARRQYAAKLQRLCGPNAAWMQLEGDAIQCTNKRGTPTRRVLLTAQVQP